MNLTAENVRKLAAPTRGQVVVWDELVPRFGLRLSAGGARTWIVSYKMLGRRRWYTIGTSPLVSLADARQKAKLALARVVQGEDPATERQDARKAATVEEVAREYIAHAKKTVRSWREKQRMLESDVIPAWGARKAADITARDVRVLTDAIVDRGAPIAANRTFALIRRVFTWASAPDRGLVPQHHNPCRGMEHPAPERSRERVLTADELRAVWQAVEQERPKTAALFRLYLLTAQRGGELKTMRWQDVDLTAQWWTIPGERAKNGRAHRVPLSPPAVVILRELYEQAQDSSSPWVFPSSRAEGGRRTTVVKATERLRAASGVDFWPHDLRRTVTTFLTGELGVSRLTAVKLLNHSDRGVTAIYDRASYDNEKRRALDAWARRLDAIVSGEQPAKVVAIR